MKKTSKKKIKPISRTNTEKLIKDLKEEMEAKSKPQEYDFILLRNIRKIRSELEFLTFAESLNESSKWSRFYMGVAVAFLITYGLTEQFVYLFNSLIWLLVGAMVGLRK